MLTSRFKREQSIQLTQPLSHSLKRNGRLLTQPCQLIWLNMVLLIGSDILLYIPSFNLSDLLHLIGISCQECHSIIQDKMTTKWEIDLLVFGRVLSMESKSILSVHKIQPQTISTSLTTYHLLVILKRDNGTFWHTVTIMLLSHQLLSSNMVLLIQ